MKSIFILISLLTQAVFAADVLNFQQTLQRALERSPEFSSLALKAQNAKWASTSAWTALLPTIDLQASYAYNRQNTSNYFTSVYQHAPWSNQAGVSINENLYDNGVTWRLAKISDLNEKAQELGLQSGRDRLLVNVAKAYYDFSLAMGTADLQRQQIETLKTQFRTIEGRYRQGVSSNRDYIRIKAQVQSAEISLLSQEIQIQETKQALRLLVGDAEATEFKPLQPKRSLLKDLPSKISEKATYEFRIAEIQERISEVTYESANRLQWPRLSLKGSYNYTVPQYLGEKFAGVDDPYWNLQVMLILDYRLWDWGTSQRTVRIAENQKRVEQNTQVSSRLKVSQDLLQLENQMRLIQQSYDVSQQILKANQLAYDSLNRGYRDGKISYLDLITALNTLYSSRSQDLSLCFNFLKSRLEWAYYEGTVDEALKIQ